MNFSPLTVSITGTVNPTASFAVAVPPLIMAYLHFSLSGSGGAQVGGAANIVGDPFIWSGHGGAQVGGAANVPTIYSVTASGGVQAGGAATVGYYALNPTLAAVLPPLAASVIGYYSVLNAVLPPIAASASAVLGGVGSMSVRLPAVQSAFASGTSSCAVMLPPLQASVTGLLGTFGSLGVNLPQLSASAVGNGVIVGNLAEPLPALHAAAVGLMGGIGQLAVGAQGLRASMVGQPGQLGVLAAELPSVIALLGGYETTYGSLNAALPTLLANAEAVLRARMQLFLVANTKTAAVSTYQGVAANSLCRFNGMTLMADATGIHVMDADDDNGTPIDAAVTFGKLDLGSRTQKRVVDAYIGLRAAGDMVVGVNVDEGDDYEFTLLAESTERLKERRVKLARGLKGMYWQLSVKNVAGGDFDADKIELAVQDNDRKI